MNEPSPLLRRLAAMDAVCARIPRGSYGVVAVDPFDFEPGEELSLVAVFPSREVAEAAIAKMVSAERDREHWMASSFQVYEGVGSGEPE
ncbi:hypothetical protein A2cp1_3688 [Anaeromyxobacter dehalogenans 2CP-1]|uniref:Uncharacterized protein n=1 Tax=Anaeromyxobacter dehalogenans (strain ATCC BAA-258 / DSM 21875 / 2CP-1) TaxID=455488 RepID=B8J6P3_ANAD2|nr:hypothetical protein [Anaeromyxobacter dehalogenans]ACL67015.1 hypothetical protein A2cp1_3688 [Anaeromyxobacter dehalogenans 2CP-1]